MISFITDSIYIKNKYRDFTFLSQAFIWKVKTHKNEAHIEKRNIHNLDIDYLTYTGVVSPSNYRLQYELLTLNKETRFYAPEDFLERKPYWVDFKKVEKEFDNYLKRSFISYLNYDYLKNIGVKRIEQFIILLSTIASQNMKSIDNLSVPNNSVVESITKIKEDRIEINGIKLLNFINLLNKTFKYSFEDLSKAIIKEYSRLSITDPFVENGFYFINDKNHDMYDIGKSLELISVDIDVYKCVIKDEKEKKRTILIRKPKADISEHLYDYLYLQKEDYFPGKILRSNKEPDNILLVEQAINGLFPLKDFILTLKLLIKLKKIENKNMNISVSNEVIEQLKPKANSAWVKKDIWNEIYSSESFNFSSIINPVDTKHSSFKCPVCGNENYKITPLKLFCGNIHCGFKFIRNNLKKFEINRISVENIIEGLNNGSILLRSEKNKNYSAFVENKGNTFYFLLKL